MINNIMNKYEKWYDLITKRGQTRILDSYGESHHILPKSLGGSDDVNNITHLTAREHFICHWLLTKIYKEGEPHWKMLNAIRMMRAENKNQNRYKNKITARVYANLKEEYSIAQSKKMTGENNPMYGKPVSQEVRKGRSERALINNPAKRPEVGIKISKSKIGVKREKFTDEWKANMSAAKVGENNNMYGKMHKQTTLEIMRQKALGRKQSTETIAKKANAIRGSKRQKKLCPHCNQEVAVNGYARWHGDNCKHIN